MPVIIPANAAQVLVPFTHSGLARKAAVTFGIDVSAFAGGDLPGKIQTNISANLGGAIDTSVTVGPVIVRVGTGGSDPIVLTASGTFAGSSNSEKVCSNVALVVAKRTALGGRRNRGRYYWPWMLSDSAVDEIGTIAGADVTGLQTAHTAFLTALATSAGGVAATPMVILHSVGAGGTPITPTAVVSVVVESVVGTQRRRLVRS